MSLSLRCPCGVGFEVEETFAGQDVACPECQRPLRAPALQVAPRRTSGLALASAILAVAGTFTVVGTAVAVLLGVLALAGIARHRELLAGAGYAIFGIVWGVVFTGLALFAYNQGELFGVNAWIRDTALAGQVNYDGPLEVVLAGDGFAITRPSKKWGVARRSIDPVHWPDDPDRSVDLLLMNVPESALVDVTFAGALKLDLERCQDRVLSWFHARPPPQRAGREDRGAQFTQCQLRHSRRLKPQGRAEIAELLLDVRYAGEPRTYLVRLVKRKEELFVLRGWAPRGRYAQMEPEIRRALDSFRLLND